MQLRRGCTVLCDLSGPALGFKSQGYEGHRQLLTVTHVSSLYLLWGEGVEAQSDGLMTEKALSARLGQGCWGSKGSGLLGSRDKTGVGQRDLVSQSHWKGSVQPSKTRLQASGQPQGQKDERGVG